MSEQAPPDPPARAGRSNSGRGRRIAFRIVYWIAVLVVSLAILVALILFLESRDESSVDSGFGPTSAQRT